MSQNMHQVGEVIAMVWCDKTSFEDIFNLTGLSESDTIVLMRHNLKPSVSAFGANGSRAE